MSEELFNNNECPNCTIHIPKEAYFFIPDLYDEMLYDNKNEERSLRLIFDKRNTEDFLEHETKHFNNFKVFFDKKYKNSFVLPEYWTDTDTRKCLQSTNFDYEKTVEKMKSVIEYPVPNLLLSEVIEILNSGFVYMHGLDKNYRPIVVVKASIFVDLIDKYSVNHFISAIKYFFDYLFKHFIIKGQVENWVIIADVSNVSLWSPPTKLLDVFAYLQNKFLCRLVVLYVYGMSFILNMCWKVIKNFIDERTTKKFNFIGGGDDAKKYVLSHINSSQLEQKYGGTAPNIEGPMDFPFYLPSDEYQVDGSNDGKFLDEKEYIRQAKEKCFKDLSPYLREKIGGKCEFETIDGGDVGQRKVIRYNDMDFYEVNSNLSFENGLDSNNKENNDIKLSNLDSEKLTFINENNSENQSKIDSAGNGNKSLVISKRKEKLRNKKEIIPIFEDYEENQGMCSCKKCAVF